MEKDLEGIGRKLVWGIISAFDWRNCGNLQTISVRIICFRAETGTQDLTKREPVPQLIPQKGTRAESLLY